VVGHQASRWRLSAAAAGLGTAGALVSSLAAPATAGVVPQLRPAAESDPRAVLLLTEASRAARMTGYSGTQYVTAWGTGAAASVVVRVEHMPGRGTVIRVQPSAAGPGGMIYEVERPGLPVPIDPLAVASVERGPLDLLRRNYQLSLGATKDRASEVIARRPNGSLAARFWIDRVNGLTTRREVYDADGTLVRATAYVDLSLGNPVFPAAVTAAVPNAEQRLDAGGVGALRREGWVLPEQFPDGMVLVDVRRQNSGKATVLHMSYTDGLSTISVFVQRGRLDTKQFSHWRQARMGGRVFVHDDGLTRHVTWSGHGRVYTVVADAPPGALTALVTRLPHGEKHRGVWGRVEHGLARLGSWLDPFN
jgi:sigma-E factor negative regulatory protein RseB